MRRAAAADKGRLHRVYRIKVDAAGAVQRADGSWEFDGVATRGDAVFDYSTEAGQEWKEYRPPEEVFSENSIASLEGATLTDDHPADFVDIWNARDLSCGTVMRAWQDGNLMRVRVIVRDGPLIQKIRDGKVELSCGYSAVVIPGDGVHPTEGAYQAKQTQIIHNHLAVVDAARAGPVARLAVPPMPAPPAPGADSKKRPDAGKGKRDSMDKIVINGVEYAVDPAATTVPAAVAEAYTAQATQLQQQATQITELQAKAGQQPAPGQQPDPNAPPANPGGPMGDKAKDKDKDKAGEKDKDKDADKDKDSKGDSVPVSKAELQAMIDQGVEAKFKMQGDAAAQRGRIIADAAPILGGSYDATGKSDAQIAADAIAACDPKNKDIRTTVDAMVKQGDLAGLAGMLKLRALDHGNIHTRSTADMLGRAAANGGDNRGAADKARADRDARRQGKQLPAAKAAGGEGK